MLLRLTIPWLHFIVWVSGEWECPNVGNVSCSCDLPHTLRCVVDRMDLTILARTLSQLDPVESVSLLDCTVRDLANITQPLFQGVSLHGLVISSGKLSHIADVGFTGLSSNLEALGLPNNQLIYVPTSALAILKNLSRLDLSHNFIHELRNNSFEGVTLLQYLDLTANNLGRISSCTFCNLKVLKSLRLQNNKLDNKVVFELKGLKQLEELDLAKNRLSGMLNWKTFPNFLSLLTILQLEHNQFRAISPGAFRGMSSLSHLTLRNNVIDIIEDHAFETVPRLTYLDLADNRIVAVSEASLAHLRNLKHLDLSHNFLRALSSDLTLPLISLTELNLDDNDISIISSDALYVSAALHTVTLADNPLNCDCSLTGLAVWLKSENTTSESRTSAVCATPPSLENGLAFQVNLDCDEHDISSQSSSLPISETQVTLISIAYTSNRLSLLWSIESNSTYTCDALLIYEELGSHELLLQTDRLACSSSFIHDPSLFPLSTIASHLQIGHRYRYCVVMLEKGGGESAPSLVLGCSEMLTLKEEIKPQIIYLDAVENNTNVAVKIIVWPEGASCILRINVSVGTNNKSQLVNCSYHDEIKFYRMPPGNVYVCISLENDEVKSTSKCLWSQVLQPKNTEKMWSPIRFIISLGLALILTGLIALIAYYSTSYFRHFGRQIPTSQIQDNQCHQTSYVLLHRTTNL